MIEEDAIQNLKKLNSPLIIENSFSFSLSSVFLKHTIIHNYSCPLTSISTFSMSPFLSKDVLVMDKQLQTTLETIYNYFSGIILRFHEPIIPEISIPYALFNFNNLITYHDPCHAPNWSIISITTISSPFPLTYLTKWNGTASSYPCICFRIVQHIMLSDETRFLRASTSFHRRIDTDS